MRTILVDWLFQAAHKFKLPSTYVHRAVRYLDIFIAHNKISKSELHAYGCAALITVDKYFSKYPYHYYEWIRISSNSFDSKQLFDAQFDCLQCLKYNVFQVTYLDVIHNYSKC